MALAALIRSVRSQSSRWSAKRITTVRWLVSDADCHSGTTPSSPHTSSHAWVQQHLSRYFYHNNHNHNYTTCTVLWKKGHIVYNIIFITLPEGKKHNQENGQENHLGLTQLLSNINNKHTSKKKSYIILTITINHSKDVMYGVENYPFFLQSTVQWSF